MTETRITTTTKNVIYEMPPWIATELASVLDHAATHYVTGQPRPVDSYDRGWLDDAEGLLEAAESLDAEAVVVE